MSRRDIEGPEEAADAAGKESAPVPKLPGVDSECDSSIGKGFRQGDRAAFRAMLDRFGPMIQRIVSSYAPNEPDAQEGLYQEVCIRVWQQRHKYDEQGKMASWLSTLAHRHIRNCNARANTRGLALDRYRTEHIPKESIPSLLANPARLLRYRRIVDRVQKALEQLPDRQSRAFRLVVVLEYSPAEAAKELGVSQATVRSNIRHARAKLRELLTDVTDELS